MTLVRRKSVNLTIVCSAPIWLRSVVWVCFLRVRGGIRLGRGGWRNKVLSYCSRSESDDGTRTNDRLRSCVSRDRFRINCTPRATKGEVSFFYFHSFQSFVRSHVTAVAVTDRVRYPLRFFKRSPPIGIAVLSVAPTRVFRPAIFFFFSSPGRNSARIAGRPCKQRNVIFFFHRRSFRKPFRNQHFKRFIWGVMTFDGRN